MNLLLDTHVWLWSVLRDERLSTRMARELRRPANGLWLLSISVWEAVLLCERGRLTPAEDAQGRVKMALTGIPLTEAPFTHDVVLTTRTIRLAHRDPSDRLLVATAKVLGLTPVTADKRLIEARQVSVLANR